MDLVLLWALVWIVVSLLATYCAARDRASLWWFILGPVGWIIAAIHSTDHEHGVDTTEPHRVRPNPARRSATAFGQAPAMKCGACGADVPRHRTLCPACGASME